MVPPLADGPRRRCPIPRAADRDAGLRCDGAPLLPAGRESTRRAGHHRDGPAPGPRPPPGVAAPRARIGPRPLARAATGPAASPARPAPAADDPDRAGARGPGVPAPTDG